MAFSGWDAGTAASEGGCGVEDGYMGVAYLLLCISFQHTMCFSYDNCDMISLMGQKL